MRIRLSYTDTHPTPLHARGGRYTRRSGGESAIAAAARSLHLSTRDFAARQAQQPAPASSSGEASGWYILRAKGSGMGGKSGRGGQYEGKDKGSDRGWGVGFEG